MAGRTMLKQLKHFKECAYIHGGWRSGARGETFPVFNPSTGENIANVADFHEADVRKAIESSNEAFQKWR